MTFARSGCGRWRPSWPWPGRGPGRALEAGGDAAGAPVQRPAEKAPIQGPEGAREREARRGRRGPRLVARHLRPEQPVPAAEGDREAHKPGGDAALDGHERRRDRRRRRLDRRRRRRRQRARPAAATPAPPAAATPARPAATRRPRRPVPLRRRPDLHGERPQAHIKGMERLEMLPSEASPLLIFLGVSANAGNAVFLVDSTLEAAGEGTCKPRASECAFLVHRRRLGARVHERRRRLVHPADRRDPEGAGGRRRPPPAAPSGRAPRVGAPTRGAPLRALRSSPTS